MATDSKWYDDPIKATIIAAIAGGFIALVGQIGASVIPIWLGPSDQSDFTISTDLLSLETSLDSIGKDQVKLSANPLAMNPETPTLKTIDKLYVYFNIKVDNLIWIKPYPHYVYIRSLNMPNGSRSYIFPVQGTPTFNSKVVIEVPRNANISNKEYPITIQGIGGDGKIRNCTFFLNLW